MKRSILATALLAASLSAQAQWEFISRDVNGYQYFIDRASLSYDGSTASIILADHAPEINGGGGDASRVLINCATHQIQESEHWRWNNAWIPAAGTSGVYNLPRNDSPADRVAAIVCGITPQTQLPAQANKAPQTQLPRPKNQDKAAQVPSEWEYIARNADGEDWFVNPSSLRYSDGGKTASIVMSVIMPEIRGGAKVAYNVLFNCQTHQAQRVGILDFKERQWRPFNEQPSGWDKGSPGEVMFTNPYVEESSRPQPQPQAQQPQAARHVERF